MKLPPQKAFDVFPARNKFQNTCGDRVGLSYLSQLHLVWKQGLALCALNWFPRSELSGSTIQFTSISNCRRPRCARYCLDLHEIAHRWTASGLQMESATLPITRRMGLGDRMWSQPHVPELALSRCSHMGPVDSLLFILAFWKSPKPSGKGRGLAQTLPADIVFSLL